ncbi:MAG: PQQ-binding-like beta-propeller repeat protein, partial [Methanoculleus sp.]|nr:PQQ-binding-like beta-propeller repeat protein [Methanoculleus sp.]
RLDAAGEEEWREALPGMKVSSVAKTPDGGYLAAGWLWNPAGSENETTGVLVKTDGNGKPIWNRTFPGTAVNTAIVASDGGCLVGGTSSPFTYDVGDGFLIRLDADGNTLWSRNYQVPVIFDLEETADGGFVYSGNYWYGLVDQDGDEAWARKMEGLTGYAVGIQPSGGYLVAGTNAASGEGFVFGTAADGAILWKMTFPGSRVYAAASAPGGGYVLAGIQIISTGNSTAWLAGITEPGEETEEPAPTTTAPGFGAAAAGAALLILIATRCRRG